MRSSVSSRPSDVVSALLVDASERDHGTIADHLRAYPTPLLQRLVSAQCRIRPLAESERYRDVSPALRRLGVDVDAWPVPPAGLFVVEERTVYLRSLSPMTNRPRGCACDRLRARRGRLSQRLRSADSRGVRGGARICYAVRRDGARRAFRRVRARICGHTERSMLAVAARDARAAAYVRSRDVRDRRGNLRRLARNAGNVGVAQCDCA